MLQVRNYIRGEWSVPSSGSKVEIRNPADCEELIGRGYFSGKQETEAAICAAYEAYGAWAATPTPKRGLIIERTGELLKANQEELARLLTREEGKTLEESLGEIQRAHNVLTYVAGECRRPSGDIIPSEQERSVVYTKRQPLGVVALITPWNFPIAIPSWKIAPALAAGNTIVFKPSSKTPLTSARLIELFEQAGTPRGVINMVIGSSEEVGETLTCDRRVSGVSFTGSSENGARIYSACANRGAKVQCEMGGKNGVLVLADADLDLSADGIVAGAFGSTGQRCTSTSRVVVEDLIADELIAKVVQRANVLKVGNGLEPGIQMGPLVSQAQLQMVEKYIEIGKKDGAKLLCGGGRVDSHSGFFLEPTIFDRVEREHRIAQEEIFGPVLSVIRVGTYEEGLDVINDSEFGLAASIYSNDNARILDFCEQVEVGMVHVNSPTVGGEAQIPFGGIKGSGIGSCEQGPIALEFYSELKIVYLDYTGQTRKGKLY